MERLTSPNFINLQNENIEKTLCIIKPDGMQFRDNIVKKILEANFHIVQFRIVKLTVEQAAEFYKNSYENNDNNSYYTLKIIHLTNGPIEVLCLAKVHAIKEFQALMGIKPIVGADTYNKQWPGSLRFIFTNRINKFQNILHGSKTIEQAKYEIGFFFPNLILEPITSNPEIIKTYLQTYIYPTLMDGLYKTICNSPNDPVFWLAHWLLHNSTHDPIIDTTNLNLIHQIQELNVYLNQHFINEMKNNNNNNNSEKEFDANSILCECKCSNNKLYDILSIERK